MKLKVTGWFAALAFATLSAGCGQTDAGISTAVKTKLAADDTVKAYQIDVDTSDKTVTLSGAVESPMAKTKAVELARATDGVRGVVDNIRVTEQAAAAPDISDATRAAFSDTTLTASVKTKLLADPMVGGLTIDVDTTDGVVSLTGKVKSQAEKDQALKLARETDGVKSVADRLTLQP